MGADGSIRGLAKFWPISSEPTIAIAVADQTAVRLVREDHLRDPGDRQRIDQAGDQREQQEDDDRGADCGLDVGAHGRVPSSEAEAADGQVDELDADERSDDPADAVDCEIAAQDFAGGRGPIFHALERERDQRRDDQRVEDDRRQDRAVSSCAGA